MDCYLYWIRLPSHYDITCQGYVGITDNLHKRFDQHNKSSQYNIHKAIKKYGSDNLIYESVFQSSRENCLSLERLLRPSTFIGWNIAAGGRSPGASSSDSKKQSVAWMNKLDNKIPSFDEYLESVSTEISSLQKEYLSLGETEPFSEGHKRKFSIKKKLHFLEKGPWSNSQASSLWMNADKYYLIWMGDGCCGSRRLSRLLGFSDRVKTITNIVRHFQLGWVPEKDTRWILYANNQTET